MNTEALPKKSLGQHWLNDEVTLQAICTAAKLATNDTVLEVGPGLGSLTQYLVKRAGRVIAVEKDEMLAARLKTLNLANLQIEVGDILAFDLSLLPHSYKVVANIPYYLTSNL